MEETNVKSASPTQPEIKSQLQPPESSQVEPAGVWARFWAGVIDGLIFPLPVLLIIIITLLIKGVRISEGSIEASPLYAVLSIASYFLYYVYLTSNKGATIGKDAYGLKVVKFGTDELITYKKGVIRELVKFGVLFIPVLGVLFNIINGFKTLLSKDKRGFHDLAANTQVLRVKKAWSMKKQIIFFGGYALAFILLIAIWPSTKRKLSPYLPTPTTRITQDSSSWETYEDKTEGWLIQYDSEKFRTRKFGETMTKFDRKPEFTEFCMDSFLITINNKAPEQDFKQWLNKKINYSRVSTSEDITINGLQGKKVVWSFSSTTTKEGTYKILTTQYYLPYDNKVFLLSYNNDYYWEFPEEECKNNEETINAFFNTFRIAELSD